MSNDYRTIKDVSEEWGISARRVQILCTEGRIPGAFKRGRTWLIPADTSRPDDRRVKLNEGGDKYFASELREKDLEILYSFLHEMRQNVSSIIGFSELAASHPDDVNATTQYIDNINISGNELLEMTNNFMTIIQIERGEIEPTYEVDNLDQSCEHIFESLSKKAKQRNIIVRCQKSIKHEYIYIDRLLSKNFVDNMINFMTKNTQYGGSVSFKINEIDSEGSDSILVRFNIAIAGGTVGKDFTKFQRTDVMFLAMKRIVELIGGRFIDAYDNYRSDNSHYSSSDIRVIFDVPFKLAEVEEVSDKSVKPSNPEKYKGMRVLIAEDNELNRSAAQMILEDEGFLVETADDGIFAVAMLERAIPEYYDLILMDLQMPNVNGATATRLIRGFKDVSKSSIPVLAMTANVSEKDKREAMAAGMNGFLEKPIDINKFYGILAALKG